MEYAEEENPIMNNIKLINLSLNSLNIHSCINFC